MIILSYLFKKPTTGDRGNILFQALEDNIQKLNDHTHNGTNSSKLAGSSITADITVTNLIPDVNEGEGTWSKLVNLPSGYTYDGQRIQFRLNASPFEYVYPKFEWISASQIKYYTNDTTVAFDLMVGG
jgi:hypothetical protein